MRFTFQGALKFILSNLPNLSQNLNWRKYTLVVYVTEVFLKDVFRKANTGFKKGGN